MPKIPGERRPLTSQQPPVEQPLPSYDELKRLREQDEYRRKAVAKQKPTKWLP